MSALLDIQAEGATRDDPSCLQPGQSPSRRAGTLSLYVEALSRLGEYTRVPGKPAADNWRATAQHMRTAWRWTGSHMRAAMDVLDLKHAETSR